MLTLTMPQIASYAIGAGLSGEQAAIATAIGRAESGGRTDARGDTGITTRTWGPSIGIWQIRSLNAQRGTGGERDEIANLDPAKNARAMMSISGNGSNWRPWSVYTSGAYRAHLAEARLAVAAPTAGGASDAGTAPASTGGGASILTDGGSWTRVGLFIVGGGFTLIALSKMTGLGGAVVQGAKIAVKARTGGLL